MVRHGLRLQIAFIAASIAIDRVAVVTLLLPSRKYKSVAAARRLASRSLVINILISIVTLFNTDIQKTIATTSSDTVCNTIVIVVFVAIVAFLICFDIEHTVSAVRGCAIQITGWCVCANADASRITTGVTLFAVFIIKDSIAASASLAVGPARCIVAVAVVLLAVVTLLKFIHYTIPTTL